MLLEKDLPKRTAADAEASVDITVDTTNTQDSLTQVGNTSMTRRGGKRAISRTVSNGSKSTLESSLGAMNDSWTDPDNEFEDTLTFTSGSVDSREQQHVAIRNKKTCGDGGGNSKRKPRRSGKRNKGQSSSSSSPRGVAPPKTQGQSPSAPSSPSPADYEDGSRDDNARGGRRTRTVSMEDPTNDKEFDAINMEFEE